MNKILPIGNLISKIDIKDFYWLIEYKPPLYTKENLKSTNEIIIKTPKFLYYIFKNLIRFHPNIKLVYS